MPATRIANHQKSTENSTMQNKLQLSLGSFSSHDRTIHQKRNLSGNLDIFWRHYRYPALAERYLIIPAVPTQFSIACFRSLMTIIDLPTRCSFISANIVHINVLPLGFLNYLAFSFFTDQTRIVRAVGFVLNRAKSFGYIAFHDINCSSLNSDQMEDTMAKGGSRFDH